MACFRAVPLAFIASLILQIPWSFNLMAAERNITVFGEAKKMISPDEVLITFAVETRHSDVKQAQDQNNVTSRRILSMLKELKIPERDTQTSFIQLLPQIQHQYGERQGQQEPKIHYLARKEMKILLRQLERYEELMTRLVGAGVNLIQSVEFSSSKAEQLRNEARQEALRNAQSKAAAMAQTLGVKLGDVQTIQEGHGTGFPRAIGPATFEARAFDEGPTVALGEINIEAKVTVQFGLR